MLLKQVVRYPWQQAMHASAVVAM
jgi:hypothetical protein